MRTLTALRLATLLTALLLAVPVGALAVQCPDGTFHPLASITCDMSFNPDGVFNFTTVTIPAGVTVRFTRNALNTPVFINATGDVVIDGAIELSATGQTGGVGGSVTATRGEPRQETVGDVRVNNQFGPGRLDVVREQELCVPAVILP